MNLNHIVNKVNGRKGKPQGVYHDFAVLLPLIYTDQGLKILFEVRSENLNRQPGEICFPGGKVEPNETFLQTAIRETCEELNISKENLEVIGELDYLVTPYNLIIYPYIGVIKGLKYEDIKYNTDEVSEIFLMDLDFALNTKPDVHQVDLLASPKDNFPYDLIIQGREYKWRVGKYPVPFYVYKDKIIWGFTARVLMNFVGIIS